MVSHWGLSYNKSSQVSRSLLSILADLNNAVVVMVSTRPLISKTAIPCTNPLVTVPRPPITVGITVTFMFHSLFSSLERSRYLSLFFFFFFFFFAFLQFYPVVTRNGKVHNSTVLFFVFFVLFFLLFSFVFLFVYLFVCFLPSLGLVIWPRIGDPFVSQNQSALCVSFSWTDFWFCIFHLFVWLNLNFLHNSQ